MTTPPPPSPSGFIRVYDGNRYLVLLDKKYRSIFDRIRHLAGVKSGIT